MSHQVVVAVRSSMAMHDAALDAILRAPLLFFQQNPAGRILNRLGTDLLKVDLILPEAMSEFTEVRRPYYSLEYFK